MAVKEKIEITNQTEKSMTVTKNGVSLMLIRQGTEIVEVGRYGGSPNRSGKPFLSSSDLKNLINFATKHWLVPKTESRIKRREVHRNSKGVLRVVLSNDVTATAFIRPNGRVQEADDQREDLTGEGLKEIPRADLKKMFKIAGGIFQENRPKKAQ